MPAPVTTPPGGAPGPGVGAPGGAGLVRLCPACGHDMSAAVEGRGGDGGAGLAGPIVCPECGHLSAVLTRAAQGAGGAALGSHAARGFTFMLAQGLGTRVLSLACQVALARILAPEDWGVVAVAMALATFANLFQLIGVREVLVARQRKFAVWANAGFWMMTIVGWATAGLVAAIAPLVARAYHNPEIMGVMMVIGVSIPIGSMGVVAEARLQAQLRFKTLAGIVAVWATLNPILTVAFAAMGLGPYSFVLPSVIVNTVRAAMAHRAARLPLRMDPQFRRWRYLLGTSVLFFFTGLTLLVTQIGDRPLLSLFVDEHYLGFYTFAFAFSLQAIIIISVNLQQILFATLAKLNDEPDRQLRAFIRASRALAMLVAPVCLVQSMASAPLVHTIFSFEKWGEAVPAMQALGLGMAFHGAFCPAPALLDSHRRFGLKLRLAVANAVVLVTLVTAGAWIGLWRAGQGGAITGGAIGVAVSLTVMNPVWSYLTTRTLGGSVGQTVGIIARPLIVAAFSVLVGGAAGIGAQRALAGVALRGVPLEHWARLAAVCGVSVLVYVPLARVVMPEEFREVASKALGAVRRVAPRPAAVGARVLRL